MKNFFSGFWGAAMAVFFLPGMVFALSLDGLSGAEIKKVENLILKLTPVVEKKQAEGTLVKLRFDDLYEVLNRREADLLRKFHTLDPEKLRVKIPFRGMAAGDEELVRLPREAVLWEGTSVELPPQFLPRKVYEAYLAMMEAMRQDLGKRLYVESGYRSSAYQLYLFIFYLKNHGYSIRETVKFVALPGYSEHGSPEHQAIDFINEQGISGESDPEAFARLPEYRWLVRNAVRFGFVLSYPEDSPEGYTFEPWHWRYDENLLSQKKTP